MKETGGYAFATASDEGYQSGMTLRDYFAGQAIIGLITAFRGGDGSGHTRSDSDLATDAYGFADVMLAEREKE